MVNPSGSTSQNGWDWAWTKWRFQLGRTDGEAVRGEAKFSATFRLRVYRPTRLAYSAATLAPPPAMGLVMTRLVGETCDAVGLGFLIQASGVATDFQVLSGTNETMVLLGQREVRRRQFLPAKQEGVPARLNPVARSTFSIQFGG